MGKMSDKEIRLKIGADMDKQMSLFNKVDMVTDRYHQLGLIDSFTEADFAQAYANFHDSDMTNAVYEIVRHMDIDRTAVVYNERCQQIWFNTELFATTNSTIDFVLQAAVCAEDDESLSLEQRVLRLLCSKLPLLYEARVQDAALIDLFMTHLTDEDRAFLGDVSDDAIRDVGFAYFAFNVLLSVGRANDHMQQKVEQASDWPELAGLVMSMYNESQWSMGAMKILRYLLKTAHPRLPLDALYAFWRSVYQLNNTRFALMHEGFEATYDPNDEAVKRRIDTLRPLCDKNGYITIYRGETNHSLPYKEALSWTLSKDVACSFAFRYKGDVYRLVEALVHIDHVYDSMIHDSELTREELELLVNPKRVKVVRVVELDNAERMLDTLSKVKAPPVPLALPPMRGSSYFDLFVAASQLLAQYARTTEDLFVCSDLHGLTHSTRVLCHAITNFYHYKEEYKLNGEDLAILIASAMLHDIGRVHDEEDYLHGAASVVKMKERGLDTALSLHGEALDITSFIMATHNIPDKLAYKELKQSGIRNKKRARILYDLLCDADNLDRVRLGDLNIAYLRHTKTKLSVEYAHVLLSQLPSSDE